MCECVQEMIRIEVKEKRGGLEVGDDGLCGAIGLDHFLVVAAALDWRS
jgi:hypothetical protein